MYTIKHSLVDFYKIIKFMTEKFTLKFKKIYLFFQNNFYFRAIIYSILAFLFLRLFTSLVLLIGIVQPSPVMPYTDVSLKIFQQLEQQSTFSKYFLSPWYRWDTIRYLEIADFGYEFDLVNTVWPPLFPFVIKVLGFFIQPSILSAIIGSNIFFIVGTFLTILLVKELFDEETAKNTIFFLVTFPTSFYLVAGYSESLFLTLSVAVFLLIRRKKWLWAGVISAFAALSRVQGIILVVPIFIELIRDYYKDRNLRNLLTNSLSCIYAPFAYGIYSLYVHYGLNTNWPWDTLSAYWAQSFAWPWEGYYYTFLSILGNTKLIDYSPTIVKILNILFSFFSIYILFKIRKIIPISLSIYSWVMLFIIIGKIDYNDSLVSTIRYILTLFPIFIALAVEIKNKYIKICFSAVGVMLHTILLVYFFWWFWVA